MTISPRTKLFGNLIRGEVEILQLSMEYGFQVIRGYLVFAFSTGIFRRIRRYGHLAPAMAENEAGKEVCWSFGGFLPFRLLFPDDGIALIPQFSRNNGLYLNVFPFLFGLYDPFLAIAQTLGVIEPVFSLAVRSGEDGQWWYRRTLILFIVRYPLSLRIRATVFLRWCSRKCRKIEFGNWNFFGFRDELFVLPAIAEGGLTAEGLPKFCPDRDGSGHP